MTCKQLHGKEKSNSLENSFAGRAQPIGDNEAAGLATGRRPGTRTIGWADLQTSGLQSPEQKRSTNLPRPKGRKRGGHQNGTRLFLRSKQDGRE